MLYEKGRTKVFVMSNGQYVDILAKSEPRCHCYSFRKGEGTQVIRKNVKALLERTGKGDCKELIKAVLADEVVARSYEVSKYAMSSRNSHYSLCVQRFKRDPETVFIGAKEKNRWRIRNDFGGNGVLVEGDHYGISASFRRGRLTLVTYYGNPSEEEKIELVAFLAKKTPKVMK